MKPDSANHVHLAPAKMVRVLVKQAGNKATELFVDYVPAAIVELDSATGNQKHYGYNCNCL
jgi:hypothetical protein